MTYLEFENFTGLVTDYHDYQEIEEMYMDSGDDISKEEFCGDYVAHRKSILLKAFYDQTLSLKKDLADKEDTLVRIARFLVHKSMEGGDQQMIDEAIIIMGKAAYLQYKIEKKLTFLTFDWDLTVKIINKTAKP